MDWAATHYLNKLLLHHPDLAEVLKDFSAWSAPALALATIALWLLGRPGGSLRWKQTTVSALASAAVAMAANQAISHAWMRERPTSAHPEQAHLFNVGPSADPSFPSDHAAAAFAIAFAVFFVSRRAGIGFLVVASTIAVDRVLLGLHYVGDIAGGMLVGLAAAVFVHVVLQRPIVATAALVSRATDPIVRPLWRRRDE